MIGSSEGFFTFAATIIIKDNVYIMPHPSNAVAACISFELKKLTRVKLFQLLNTVDCVL